MSLSIALDPCPRIYKCMARIFPAVFIILRTPTGVETNRGQAIIVCIQGIKLTGGLPNGTLEVLPADENENSA